MLRLTVIGDVGRFSGTQGFAKTDAGFRPQFRYPNPDRTDVAQLRTVIWLRAGQRQALAGKDQDRICFRLTRQVTASESLGVASVTARFQYRRDRAAQDPTGSSDHVLQVTGLSASDTCGKIQRTVQEIKKLLHDALFGERR